MAALTTMLIGAAVGLGAYSADEGYQARQDAKEAANRSFEEQKKVQGEQRALQAQAQANERRQQIREERVKRARVLQAAQNTGTAEGSGVAGATGSLATTLGVNLGINVARAAAGDRIGTYSQNAENFQFQSQSSMMDAQNYDKHFGLSTSIFSAAGGFGATGQTWNR
jgi:hypothetical protein